MTYREIYDLGSLKLKACEIDEYALDARCLLEFVMNTTPTTLYANPSLEVSKEDCGLYLDLIEKRGKHIPLQHLTQSQWFMGLEFKVSPDVLIPRQDTECLVEYVQQQLHDGMSILDMCTGSGCILLSLLKYSNDCSGMGVDISLKALQIARENALKLGFEDKIKENRLSFVESDLFEKVEGNFDIIVSNPPYIVTCEIETLMPEVKDHEPFIALNGKEDGLFFYRRISRQAQDHLAKGGLLAYEIGNTQAREVSSILEEEGYVDIQVFKDLAGNDRVVMARKSVMN